MATGALLLGRTTYEGFAAAWPERGQDMAGKPEPTDASSATVFEDRFNWLPKYVVSDAMADVDATWTNSQVVRGAALEETLRALKAQDGKDVYIHGSGKLINSLMPTGLIDEYHLMIHPIVVGKGQRLFPDGLPETTLALVEARTYDKGIVVLVYQTQAA
jgi:dihydrofolate reductase